MPRVPHSPWIDLPNNIWGWVQIKKLLISQSKIILYLSCTINYRKNSYKTCTTFPSVGHDFFIFNINFFLIPSAQTLQHVNEDCTKLSVTPQLLRCVGTPYLELQTNYKFRALSLNHLHSLIYWLRNKTVCYNRSHLLSSIRSKPVETVHVSLVRILMAVFDISHELEGYLLF
jgi:hypothetical protein